MELKHRGVLVTGGASGLGAACVRLLAQAGAKVVIADLNSEIGETLAAELRGEGAGVFFACANVASEESLKAAVQTTIEKCGGVHVLINCAGIAVIEKVLGKAGPHSLESFQKVINVNLIGELPEPARLSLSQQVPFPSRLGKPAEYAALAKHIVENEMLNGEVVRLDGALRMAPH